MLQTQGLLDLQVNGYAGVDFNDPALTADALDQALAAMLRDGVTACLPTLITAPPAVLAQRFAVLDAAVAGSRLGPLMVPGYHLEGPFLNPASGYAGCHPADAMGLPDTGLLEQVTNGLWRPVLLLTLAPEREGAVDVIAWARRRGILVAMGHTAASVGETARAVEAGVRLSTHLGNALPQPQPKFFNPLMAQLGQDGLAASFIADGIHVPPHALRVMLRAKGLGRSILVTDATSAAATEPGLYPFAGMTIEHAPDGSVRVPGSAVLAGSALRLDQAVRNCVAWGLAAADDAIAMASVQPAALLGAAWDYGCVDWSADLHPMRVALRDGSILDVR
jgi:N-acetylglucosamine-6-phosphate deacetylase